MGKLAGKVAIVTGARQGIGASIGKVLARHDADVVLTDMLHSVAMTSRSLLFSYFFRVIACRAQSMSSMSMAMSSPRLTPVLARSVRIALSRVSRTELMRRVICSSTSEMCQMSSYNPL